MGMVNLDNDFVINRQEIDLDKYKLSFADFGLPENLNNSRILEVFSGDKDSSFEKDVIEKGAIYYSADKARYHGEQSKNFIRADVLADDLPYAHDTFDHIIMKAPPLYTGEDHASLQLRTFLSRAFPVLKKTDGASVSMIMYISRQEANHFLDAIKSDFPELGGKDLTMWCEPTTTPLIEDGKLVKDIFAHRIRVILD